MRFLHVIASVDAAGGGPIEGATQLQRALAVQGHTGEFASLDDPAAACVGEFDTAPLHALGPARGRFGYSPAFVPWLQANAGRFDAVIVNGLWQYIGLGTRQALAGTGTPYYVFPHGMLDPWFKRRYPLKHLKKWAYWPWAEYRVLRDARRVLFTCEEERLLARQSFWLYSAREAIVSFGTAPPADDPAVSKDAFFSAFPDLRGKRTLLFLGRIHSKKGCDLLVEAFAKVCANRPEVHLVMAGPDQTHWQPTLEQMARRLGVADRICWAGMLTGAAKWGAFRSADAFCLPSHQENFGIAVVEAMACECPVLVSDKVNIWREIESAQAGLVAADTLEGTVSLLERWLAMPAPQWQQMREAARACFDAHFRMDQVARTLTGIVQDSRTTPMSPLQKQGAHV
ncbi:glycosyltransferase [Variovorax sp. OV329]|uniref:glycosyltransferase n=1 Tax=Variovorax sp. OV329 TaxID=1882825 RepID=UPI0008E5EB4C|nr:glycosyltransferase [Variovorax sp. OV329]SFM09666.1 Glycosyltransferase involved in cell wall bisynthesis [Variovorax sp. OV329]